MVRDLQSDCIDLAHGQNVIIAGRGRGAVGGHCATAFTDIRFKEKNTKTQANRHALVKKG